MSTASSVEPQGSTQLLRWVATELAILALLFGLAVIRHDHVCFICFFLLLFSFSMCTKEGSAKYYHHSNLPWVSSDSCGHFHKRDFFPCFFMCRSRRPEAGGASAGAGELLWGRQHLRWHRGQRSQLETQYTGPQCRLRYKHLVLNLLYWLLFTMKDLILFLPHFVMFLYWNVVAKFRLDKTIHTLLAGVERVVMLLGGSLPA